MTGRIRRRFLQLKLGLTVFGLGALLVLPLSAPSQAALSGYFGLLGGIALPSSSSTVFAFGVDLAFRVGPMMVDGFIQRYGVGLDVSSNAATASLSSSNFMYGLGVVYPLNGTLQGFYVGLKGGFSKSSIQVLTVDTSTSNQISITNDANPIIISPRLGYDVPIGRFAIGGDVSYVFGIGDQAPKTLFVMAIAKFVF